MCGLGDVSSYALKRVISRIFLMISNQKDIDLVFGRDELNCTIPVDGEYFCIKMDAVRELLRGRQK